jgi:hypothetical protein
LEHAGARLTTTTTYSGAAMVILGVLVAELMT